MKTENIQKSKAKQARYKLADTTCRLTKQYTKDETLGKAHYIIQRTYLEQSANIILDQKQKLAVLQTTEDAAFPAGFTAKCKIGKEEESFDKTLGKLEQMIGYNQRNRPSLYEPEAEDLYIFFKSPKYCMFQDYVKPSRFPQIYQILQTPPKPCGGELGELVMMK